MNFELEWKYKDYNNILKFIPLQVAIIFEKYFYM